MSDTDFSLSALLEQIPRDRLDEHDPLRRAYRVASLLRNDIKDDSSKDFGSTLTNEELTEIRESVQDKVVNCTLERLWGVERYNYLKIIYELEPLENFRIEDGNYDFKTTSEQREQHSSNAGPSTASTSVHTFSQLRGFRRPSQEEGDSSGGAATDGSGDGAQTGNGK